MRRRFALVMACLLVISAVSGVSANDASRTTVSVVATQSLIAAADSDVNLDKLTLVTLSDGTQRVEGTARFPLDGKTYEMSLDIEPDSGTYVAKRREVDISAAPELEVVKSASSSQLALAGASATAVNSWAAGVTLTTKDPIALELVKSTTMLWWDELPNGFLQYADRYKSTWEAYPSQAGTHWYRWSSDWLGSPIGGSSVEIWSNEHKAVFWNDDFGNDTKRTWVDHWSSIYGRHNDYYALFYFVHSGEYYFLLYTTSSEFFQ